MILLDTSIVIDYLKTTDHKMLVLFQAHDAAICGITRAEVLNGARSSADRQRLVAILDTFRPLAIPESIWDVVGNHLAMLRAKGVKVPFQDVVIATGAIENDVELWTRGSQFKHVQAVLPALKLFQEPP